MKGAHPALVNLLWSNNLWVFAAGMLGPLLAVFTERVGGTLFDIAWVYAVFSIVTGISIMGVGVLADRYGHVPLLLVGNAITAVSTFAYLLVDSFTTLIAVQVVQGIAVALQEPTWFALYDRFSGSGANDGLVWGMGRGWSYIIGGFSVLVGGALITMYSYEVLFIVMGTLHTLATLYQARIRWLMKIPLQTPTRGVVPFVRQHSGPSRHTTHTKRRRVE